MKGKEYNFDEACRFMIKLGTAAHDYGGSTIRLESYLTRLSEAFGFPSQFMVSPRWIQFMFARSGELEQSTHFVRMSSPSFDMQKLAVLEEVVDAVEAGQLTLSEAAVRLDELHKAPSQNPSWIVGLGYAFSGAGFAVLLSASWMDVFLSGALSLVVFAMALLTGRSKWLARTLEMSSAAVVSALANGIAMLLPGSDPFVVTLCALIVLIPGLALTLGLGELTAGHVISGMTRLIDGILITLKLFLGAAIGTVAIKAVAQVPAVAEKVAIPAFWVWVFVCLLVIGLAFVFQVRPRDLFWAVLGGVLAYAGIVVGGQFGFWQGSFIGALMLGVYATLFARFLNRPTSIVMLTAIMVLVPGASAYRGLEAIETSGLASGLDDEWQVLVNIGAIIAGIVVSFSIVPPKNSL